MAPMIYTDLKTEDGLKDSLQRLITPDKGFGRENIELLYHDDIHIIIIDDKGNKNEFKKPEFVELISAKIENREEHQNNSWAKFHHLQIKGNTGHIIVERRLNLTGTKTKLLVNIDFVWEEERWQITREVIYSQGID